MASKSIISKESLRLIAPVLIIAVGVGGFLVFGQKPEVAKRQPEDKSTALVRTAVAEEFHGKITLEVDGVAVPYRRVTVPAEVAGRIVYKSTGARSGSYVNKDDKDKVLFQIDKTDYELEIERLNAQLGQTDAEIASVDTDITNTTKSIEIASKQVDSWKAEVKRLEEAFRKGSIGESTLEDARRQQLSAETSLVSLQNQKRAHEKKKLTLQAGRKLTSVQLRLAQTNLDRTTIRAPVTGTVISDPVEQNDYVKPGDPLLHINDTTQAEVKCSLRVDEVYWVWLQSGKFSPQSKTPKEQLFQIPETPVKVVFHFEGVAYTWDGKLSRYEGTGLDERTRTIPCRVLIEEPTRLAAKAVRKGVKPAVVPPTIFTGMFVDVRIPIEAPVRLVEIPLAALRPGDKVWVVREGKLQVVDVSVARSTGESVLIRIDDGGLQPGEKVVTSPLANVKTGMKAREADK